jgi:hypothetical protein
MGKKDDDLAANYAKHFVSKNMGLGEEAQRGAVTELTSVIKDAYAKGHSAGREALRRKITRLVGTKKNVSAQKLLNLMSLLGEAKPRT